MRDGFVLSKNDKQNIYKNYDYDNLRRKYKWIIRLELILVVGNTAMTSQKISRRRHKMDIDEVVLTAVMSILSIVIVIVLLINIYLDFLEKQ